MEQNSQQIFALAEISTPDLWVDTNRWTNRALNPCKKVEKLEKVQRKCLAHLGKCPNEAVNILLWLLCKQLRRDLKQLLKHKQQQNIEKLSQPTSQSTSQPTSQSLAIEQHPIKPLTGIIYTKCKEASQRPTKESARQSAIAKDLPNQRPVSQPTKSSQPASHLKTCKLLNS